MFRGERHTARVTDIRMLQALLVGWSDGLAQGHDTVTRLRILGCASAVVKLDGEQRHQTRGAVIVGSMIPGQKWC